MRRFTPLVLAAMLSSFTFAAEAEREALAIDTPSDTIPSGEKARFGVGGSYSTADGDNVLVGLYKADKDGKATGDPLATDDPTVKENSSEARWSAALGGDTLEGSKYVIKAELRKGTKVLKTTTKAVTAKVSG